MKQQTLQREVVFKGTGIHTGQAVTVNIKPANEDSGIRFFRTDVPGSEVIPARIEFTGQADLAGRQTTLGFGAQQIATVEHLMAVFHGLGVDNALVEIDGGELPGLDGSAQRYAEALLEAGLKTQTAERRFIKIAEPVFYEKNGTTLALLPLDHLKISYTLSYGDQDIRDQYVSMDVTPEIFLKEIAPARTFCLRKEAELLKQKGFGQGASLENTLVFKNGAPLQNTLRFPNEAARHKILDLIGDLYLAGFPIKGHVVAVRSGHAQNLEVVRQLSRLTPVSENGRLPSKKNDTNLTGGPLDRLAIQEIIPHRYPFLWVDRIVELVPGQRAVGIKQVTMNDYFFSGHFPGHPIMPGVIIIEALAQVGAVAMMCKPEHQGRMAYFMSIDEAKFRKPVLPNCELRLEIEIVKVRSRIGQCKGVARVNGEVVCEAEVKFAFVKNEQEGTATVDEN